MVSSGKHLYAGINNGYGSMQMPESSFGAYFINKLWNRKVILFSCYENAVVVRSVERRKPFLLLFMIWYSI